MIEWQGGKDRRQRLRRLDDCLTLLEQAHEMEITVVTEKMAEALADRVPTVHGGMLVAEAIEEVLREQEPYMVQVRPEVSRPLRRPAPAPAALTAAVRRHPRTGTTGEGRP